jgi:hypothetical protein
LRCGFRKLNIITKFAVPQERAYFSCARIPGALR